MIKNNCDINKKYSIFEFQKAIDKQITS